MPGPVHTADSSYVDYCWIPSYITNGGLLRGKEGLHPFVQSKMCVDWLNLYKYTYNHGTRQNMSIALSCCLCHRMSSFVFIDLILFPNVLMISGRES